MRNKICIVGEVISLLALFAGVFIAALARTGPLDSDYFLIGVIILAVAFVVFYVFAAIRKKTYMAESDLTTDDEDFFFKPGALILFGAIGGAIAASKYSKYIKRYKQIKELYDNKEYDKVLAETKKYYPYDDDIPPSLKKLVIETNSIIRNEAADTSTVLAEDTNVPQSTENT